VLICIFIVATGIIPLIVDGKKARELLFCTSDILQSTLKDLDATHSRLSKCLQENVELKQMLAALQEKQRILEVLLDELYLNALTYFFSYFSEYSIHKSDVEIRDK